MNSNNIISFAGFKCKVTKKHYSNKRIALELIDCIDGDSVAVATINLPDVDMKPDEVAIKDYSENEGMLDILIAADIISQPIMFVRSGFINVPICKLLMI